MTCGGSPLNAEKNRVSGVLDYVFKKCTCIKSDKTFFSIVLLEHDPEFITRSLQSSNAIVLRFLGFSD